MRVARQRVAERISRGANPHVESERLYGPIRVPASQGWQGLPISTLKPAFSPDVELAYMRRVDELTVPDENGAPTTMHLRGYSIWRQDPDGQWRCVVDISNEEPPTQAAAGQGAVPSA